MHQSTRAGAATALLLCIVASTCFGIRLMTADQALKEMLPDAGSVTADNRPISGEQLSRLKQRLGGSLVHYQQGSESAAVEASKTANFYVCMKNGKKAGVAVVNEQPGKWGPVEYLVLIDPSTSKVKDVAVLAYVEKRGRPIARRNFLNQFAGKGSSDPIALGKDINGISGATISSDASCFAVRYALALYEEVYLK